MNYYKEFLSNKLCFSTYVLAKKLDSIFKIEK